MDSKGITVNVLYYPQGFHGKIESNESLKLFGVCFYWKFNPKNFRVWFLKV